MTAHPVFKIINAKFILALNTIQEAFKAHPDKKPLTDNAVGQIISPNNRGVIKDIRNGERNLNHYQMLTFADYYNIPYEYFYYESMTFSFSFEKNDPDMYVSQTHIKTLEDHFEDKIAFFLSRLKANGKDSYEEMGVLLRGFKNKTIEKMKGIPFDKALSVLDTIFSLVFTELEKQSLLTTNSKEISGKEKTTSSVLENGKINFYQDLLKTSQTTLDAKDKVIEAKDEQIEILKKYTRSLENLVDQNKT